MKSRDCLSILTLLLFQANTQLQTTLSVNTGSESQRVSSLQYPFDYFFINFLTKFIKFFNISSGMFYIAIADCSDSPSDAFAMHT